MTRATRVAVLTGAHGGIGQGILARLVADGYRVTAVDRSAPQESADESILPLAEDITSEGAGERIVDATVDRFGRLDVLIHCAGILRDDRLPNMTDDTFRSVLDVNLLAAMRLTAAALPSLRRSGSGRVVSVSSRAWLGIFGSSNYCASKGGLVGMTRALALAEGPNGVTCNAVAPGFVLTPLSAHLTGSNAVTIPVGRPGTPDDVAAAIAYFAAPDTGYVTGQVLLVCGGSGLKP